MEPGRSRLYKGIGMGLGAGVLFFVGGYLLVSADPSALGIVMFLLVPFVAGFVTAANTSPAVRLRRTVQIAIFVVVISLTVLLATSFEGIICVLMAAPVMTVGLVIGAVVGYFVRVKFLDRDDHGRKKLILLIGVCPMLVAAADQVEKPLRAIQDREVFTTEILIDASPGRVWDSLAQMEKLDGPMPLLLRMGLPLPTHCVLESAAVGGRRVCHFNQGVIVQEITDWRRGESMAFRMEKSTLPGRRWLSFIDARYEFIPQGPATKLIRHTTIGTRLSPRWYWRPLEEWGVTSEHAFVLANVKRSAEKN